METVEFDIPVTEPPADIELDRARHLRVHWTDGRTSTFALETLRTGCPCAQCRGLREQGRAVAPLPGAPDPLAAVGAELVGNWGILIRWNDGHETGIFAWGLLDEWSRADG